MMKEQKETIERLNRFKSIKVLYGNTFAMTTEQLKILQEDIETAINILKEKDKEIEEYKRIIAAGIINAEKDKLVQEKNKEIEKKDKQIDLMAIRILVKIIGDYPCTYKESCTKSDEKYRDLKCKECIKQYFERKSEE